MSMSLNERDKMKKRNEARERREAAKKRHQKIELRDKGELTIFLKGLREIRRKWDERLKGGAIVEHLDFYRDDGTTAKISVRYKEPVKSI